MRLPRRAPAKTALALFLLPLLLFSGSALAGEAAPAGAAGGGGASLSDWLWIELLPAPWDSWLRLLVAAGAVIFAGSRLSRYGDLLAGRLKLGHAVVGMIFVAFATSLPEIVTCIGSVAVQKAPGLAVGNGFGSIAFNLTIIFVVDLLAGDKSLFHYVARESARPGWLSLLLVAIFGASMALEALSPRPLRLLGIGAGSYLVVAAYVTGVWWLSRRARTAGKDSGPEAAEPEPGAVPGVSTAGVFGRYALVAAIILWAGLNLAAAGDRVADHYGLGKTFVGVMFLAIATSLPELTVAITSARAGLYEMILGNIFGANMFNVVVIALSDVFYREGSIARATVRGPEARPGVISVAFAGAISCVAIFGVIRKVRARIWRATLPSVAIALLYMWMAWWLYSLK